MKRVCVSGYFDPLHVGHIKYLEDAKNLGNVTVILNNDEQGIKSRGSNRTSVEDRQRIIKSIRYVDNVVISIDTDDSVSNTLTMLKPDIFAKGFSASESEVKICNAHNIEIFTEIGQDMHLQDLLANSR